MCLPKQKYSPSFRFSGAQMRPAQSQNSSAGYLPTFNVLIFASVGKKFENTFWVLNGGRGGGKNKAAGWLSASGWAGPPPRRKGLRVKKGPAPHRRPSPSPPPRSTYVWRSRAGLEEGKSCSGPEGLDPHHQQHPHYHHTTHTPHPPPPTFFSCPSLPSPGAKHAP